MVGGDEPVVERVRPVFATYGDPVIHLGGVGSGQMAKVLNNFLFTAQLTVAVETFDSRHASASTGRRWARC